MQVNWYFIFKLFKATVEWGVFCFVLIAMALSGCYNFTLYIFYAVERHRKEKINAGINRIGNLLPCSQALKQV